MVESDNDHRPSRAAASAVAYLDERRSRRLGIGAQLEARDRAAALLRERRKRTGVAHPYLQTGQLALPDNRPSRPRSGLTLVPA
jgi:hypothetical protein